MKLSKGEVNYHMATGQSKQCRGCTMFRPKGLHGHGHAECTLVEGIILPSAVCDRYDPIKKASA